jgi:hypothetical protein
VVQLVDPRCDTRAMNDIAPPPARPGPSGQSAPGNRVRTATFVAAAIGVLVAATILWWPRTTVVKTFSQPPGVVYSDDSLHTVVLQHVHAPIAVLRLSDDSTSGLDHYEVYLGRDPSGGYGHHVRLDATDMDPTRLTVEWATEGVSLNFGSGHRVFVPATSFVGGR